jgi:assimilatory nitrate reductase catalytic subunit
MLEKTTFLQGVFPFEGEGLTSPRPFSTTLKYEVPAGKVSQVVYALAGNSSAELIYLVLMWEGKPLRYFPVGGKAAIHVPLAVVDDMESGTSLEVLYAAPEGVTGTVVIDLGLMEF